MLRHTDLGEADRILTLYTPQWGKLRAIAKGIRRPASKLRGHLELFTRAKLMLARGRNLDVITGAETTEAFHGLREEHPDTLERIERRLLPGRTDSIGSSREWQGENRAIWDLLVADTTRPLRRGRPGRLSTQHYDLRLLGYLGLSAASRYLQRVATNRCSPIENRYSIELGGILCPECRSQDPAAECAIGQCPQAPAAARARGRPHRRPPPLQRCPLRPRLRPSFGRAIRQVARS